MELTIMPAERYAASLGNRLIIPDSNRTPSGYFRSKLFVASSTTNPLVAAASPLLSLLERLSVSPTLPAIESIRENIEHELYAFHSRLLGMKYADEFIAIAHYLLCATIDELLGKNYLRLYQEPAQFKAFTPLSADDAGPENTFFKIVNFIKERTNQYLDLLELTYYCLIAGFEGEYHLRADGRFALDNLIEELHLLIQQHRVHKPHKLFKEQVEAATPPSQHKSYIIKGLVIISALALLYFGSHRLLEYQAQNLLQKTIIHLDN